MRSEYNKSYEYLIIFKITWSKIRQISYLLTTQSIFFMRKRKLQEKTRQNNTA